MNRGSRSQLGPRLFTPPAADEETLNDRQAFVLNELRQNPAGLNSEQVGRAVHDRFVPSHSLSCPYCSLTGGTLLKQLKSMGIARLRRGGIWQAVSGAAPVADDPDDPQNQPWPDGF